MCRQNLSELGNRCAPNQAAAYGRGLRRSRREMLATRPDASEQQFSALIGALRPARGPGLTSNRSELKSWARRVFDRPGPSVVDVRREPKEPRNGPRGQDYRWVRGLQSMT